MPNEVKLLPCPFCGGEGHVWENPWETGTWEATCTRCNAGIEHRTNREEAIAAWNRRPTTVVTDEVVERVKDAMRNAPALSPTKNGVPTGEIIDFDMLARAALASMPTVVTGEQPGWQPIEGAPKDGACFLALATGADGRPLHAIVNYADRETMFSSAWVDPPPERKEIVGILGHSYGVPFKYWQPLPEPPAQPGDA